MLNKLRASLRSTRARSAIALALALCAALATLALTHTHALTGSPHTTAQPTPLLASAAAPETAEVSATRVLTRSGSAHPKDAVDRSHSAPRPLGLDRARIAALERAAGKDPRKLKAVPRIPNGVRVERGEALPCTSARQPVNFEIFSAGGEVNGIPLNQLVRRCEESVPADELPANYTSYVYGHCEVPAGSIDCEPPLEIQSFPACQRSLADYTFEGKPLPYTELPSIDGARVVEIDFQFDQRIEVYTGSTTIVIYAANPALAQAALASLRSQQAGETPVTSPSALEKESPGGLGPPVKGATEGELSCQSS